MKKLYLETHGCQMNAHDSEKAIGVLADAGYESTDQPAEADLILLNTCMVREKAARKVFTRIDLLKGLVRKARSKESTAPIFGVMGCVAQAEAARIFERSRDVRLVVGTQSIAKLPELLAQLQEGFPHAIDVRLSKDTDFIELSADRRTTEFVAYITITEGCDKFCSYCIVPFTRGRERSRTAGKILAEAKELANWGYKEIHLLGQNVNSYGLRSRTISRFRDQAAPASETEESVSFAGLLDLLGRESGIPRIKYTTSFPRDFTLEIVEVMDQHANLCEWVHLPAQAGSDRILRAMRRGYTRADYLEKISFIKSARKDLSITSDIIVGFPGETEQDFSETLSLIAEVEYDGLYIFKYSPRPRTPAQAYADSVPEDVKTDRFLRLQELQDMIQKRRYTRYLGREVEVLVEGVSARSEADLTGHTRCQKVVNFPKSNCQLGDLVNVYIEEIRHHSLYGEVTSGKQLSRAS